MKQSAATFRFWIGPGALLALVMAMAMTVEARTVGSMTPDDRDCPGAHFCDDDGGRTPGPDDVDDGDQREEREDGPDDYSDEFGNFDSGTVAGEGGSDTFHNGSIGPNEGRIGRGGRGDGRGDGRGNGRGGRGGRGHYCPDPNPYDPYDPACDDGRPGRPGRPPGPGPGPGYPGYPEYPGNQTVVERLIINRVVGFESLEINMLLGRLAQRLRGYELTGIRMLVAEGGMYRPNPRGLETQMSLLVSGRVHDSLRIVHYGRPPGAMSAYDLRTQYSVDVSPRRGERVQLTVQGEVFIGEIQLSFRRAGRR